MCKNLILVQHGQTAWTVERRFLGRSGISLDETGLAQAAAIARYIQSRWTPDAVYCSPLTRARETAEVIAMPFRLHERSHPGLLDIDFGVWAGKTEDEVQERWSQALDVWRRRPTTAPIPGGEMLETVRMRVVGALREIGERHPEQTVVLVAHAVVNRLLLLEALGLSSERFWRLGQDVAAINELEFDGQAFTLLKMNITCHLSASAIESEMVAANS